MGITNSNSQQNNNNPSIVQSNISNPQHQYKAYYQGQCDNQGRHHGKGIMKYTDGSVFTGTFIKGMPSQGLFKYLNGNSYSGQLKDNKPHGKGQWIEQKGKFIGQFRLGDFKDGEVFYSDGSYYKGQMKSTIKQGKNCYYKFNDGDIFQGQFRNDTFYKGKYTSKDHDLIYEGQFNSQSQKNGKGKLILRGLAQYQGDFFNDQFNGKGVLINLKNNTRYQGQFKQGKKNGLGKLFGPDNKLIYEGIFINNQKHGKGIFYCQKKKYQGTFVQGKFQGQGILHYGQGDVYKGTFKDNKKSGKGELCLISNTIRTYKGDFLDDKFDGYGQLIYANGDKYNGHFIANKKHGKGIYQISSDTEKIQFRNAKFQGTWINDVKNGEFIETIFMNNKKTIIKGTYKDGQKDGIFEVQQQGKEKYIQNWVMGKRIYNE